MITHKLQTVLPHGFISSQLKYTDVSSPSMCTAAKQYSLWLSLAHFSLPFPFFCPLSRTSLQTHYLSISHRSTAQHCTSLISYVSFIYKHLVLAFSLGGAFFSRRTRFSAKKTKLEEFSKRCFKYLCQQPLCLFLSEIHSEKILSKFKTKQLCLSFPGVYRHAYTTSMYTSNPFPGAAHLL